MKLFKRSRQPSNCPTCQAGIDAEQISCVECGTLLARRSALAGVAWRLPVATVGAVALVMATGIGYASGAVVQDGDVSVAEAPAPGSPEGLPGVSGSDGDGDGGGSDDLAQLDPPGDGDGDGDGSSLDSGDGDGNGDGDGDGDGDGGGDSDDDDGGDSSGGGSGGDGNRGGGSGGGGRASKGPEFGGPEESRDLATFPAGATGYTVALKVASSRAAAVREANAAISEAEGIPAGVISRSDFPSLPGAHVAFAGRFNTRAEAERAQDNYAALGFSGEVIFVGAGGG